MEAKACQMMAQLHSRVKHSNFAVEFILEIMACPSMVGDFFEVEMPITSIPAISNCAAVL